MGYLHVGGEGYSEYTAIGGPLLSQSAGTFRSGYARGSMYLFQPGGLPNFDYWSAANVFSSSAFWFSVWVRGRTGGTFAPGTISIPFRWTNGAIVRLRLRPSVGSTNFGTVTWVVEKVNAAGTATQLGSSFTIPIAESVLGKLDIRINYAVSGEFSVYANGNAANAVFQYLGDVTTDGVTTLTGYDLGTFTYGTSGPGATGDIYYSEVIVHTSPTFTMSLAYGAPTGAGNTTGWSGTWADVDEFSLSLADFNSSVTAAQVQQFVVNAIPAGNFSVRAVVVGGVTSKGTSGPTKNAWGVRSAGADAWSPDITQSPLNAPLPSQYGWDLNPITGLSWQTSEVGNAAGFNIGMRSAA